MADHPSLESQGAQPESPRPEHKIGVAFCLSDRTRLRPLEAAQYIFFDKSNGVHVEKDDMDPELDLLACRYRLNSDFRQFASVVSKWLNSSHANTILELAAFER